MSCTLDTNILVYTIGPSADPKRVRARDLVIRSMRGGTAVLLLQALAEFSSVATRKLGLDADIAGHRIAAWAKVIPVQPPAAEDLGHALEIFRDHKIPFWDALLCATAIRAGARYLLTEDLQDGRLLRSLAIVNPFASKNDALIDRILPS